MNLKNTPGFDGPRMNEYFVKVEPAEIPLIKKRISLINKYLLRSLRLISEEKDPKKRKEMIELMNGRLEKVGKEILEIKTKNKDITIWEKIKKFYNKVVSMLKKGAQYLVLALITLSFIIIVMLIMTNGEFHKFLYGLSDIFFRTLKFLKNIIFGIIEGVLSLDGKLAYERLKKTYDKYITQIKDILSMMERAGIDKRSIPVVLGCITASFIIAKSIADEYIG